MVWNLLFENPDLKISWVIMLGSQQTSPPRLPISEGLYVANISSQFHKILDTTFGFVPDQLRPGSCA